MELTQRFPLVLAQVQGKRPVVPEDPCRLVMPLLCERLEPRLGLELQLPQAGADEDQRSILVQAAAGKRSLAPVVSSLLRSAP